jgi:hypothetical protein
VSEIVGAVVEGISRCKTGTEIGGAIEVSTRLFQCLLPWYVALTVCDVLCVALSRSSQPCTSAFLRCLPNRSLVKYSPFFKRRPRLS